MLPATPSVAAARVQVRKTACRAASETCRKGSTASGSTHWREIATVHSAVLRLPKRRVIHDAGSCTSCAVNGSAPSTPMSSGESPR